MAKSTKKTDLESTSTPESTPAQEIPQSYQATVTAAAAVLRQTPGTADKPVATLAQGTKVTITESRDGFGKLGNGLWIREAYLDRA